MARGEGDAMTDSLKRPFAALVALGAGALLCGMAPGEMSVATFLARADALSRLGPLAMAAPDASALKAEVAAAGQRYRASIEAARKAGRKTTSCPPQSGSLSPDQWLAHLRSYPEHVRDKVTINAAFDGLMRKRYPCPA